MCNQMDMTLYRIRSSRIRSLNCFFMRTPPNDPRQSIFSDCRYA